MALATPSLDLIPAMLFGVLIGALIPLFLPAYQVQPVVVSGLITSATAVFVGGWLQRGLGRRAVLERIPLTYISNLADGIDRLTSECLENYIHQAALPSLVLLTEQNHEGLANLRRLSQETRLFLELLEETGGNEMLKSRLTRSYLGFQRASDRRPAEYSASHAGQSTNEKNHPGHPLSYRAEHRRAH